MDTFGSGFTTYDTFAVGLSEQKWDDCASGRSALALYLQLSLSCTGMQANRAYSLVSNIIPPTSPVIGLQADVMVPAGATVASGGQVRASLELDYQVASKRGVTNLGRYVARIELRDEGAGLVARAYAFLCLEDRCNGTATASATLVGTNNVNNATVTVDTFNTLRVQYDSGNNRFVMTLGAAVTIFDAASLAGFNAADFNRARTRVQVINGGTDGADGAVSANFENVQIDTGSGLTAFDDFSSGGIDNTRWVEGPSARAVSGGLLAISQTQANTEQSVYANLLRADAVSGMRADMTVTQSLQTGPSPLPTARMELALFNDGSAGDGNGGRNGDIVALLALSKTDAYLQILRCTTAACLDTTVVSTTAIGATTLNTTYTVELSWDGTHVQYNVATLGSGSVTPPIIPVSARPHGGPLARIGTRIENAAFTEGSPITFGDTATIVATFKNVAISQSALNEAIWTACDAGRSINNGALQLDMTCNAMPADALFAQSENSIPPASPVIGIEGTVRLLPGYVLPSGGQVRASLELRYQSPLLRSQGNKGAIYARIELRDQGAGVVARAYAFECLNDACNGSTIVSATLIGNNDVNFVTVFAGVPKDMKVQYDGAGHFVMTLGTAITTFDATSLPDFNAANFVQARPRVQILNGGTAGASGTVVGLFDDILLDTGAGLTAFDSFSAATIDTSKWVQGESYRRGLSGSLVVSQSQANSESAERIDELNGTGVTGVKADVTVLEYSKVGSVLEVTARIGVPLYNDGTAGDGLGGRNGDIQAEFVLFDTLAELHISRCTTSTCQDPLILNTIPAVTTGAVTLGSMHTLTLYWNGSVVTYQLDAEAVQTFDPTADSPIVSATPASGRGAHIGTRVSSPAPPPGTPLSPGASGHIKATFDNVAVYK